VAEARPLRVLVDPMAHLPTRWFGATRLGIIGPGMSQNRPVRGPVTFVWDFFVGFSLSEALTQKEH
jgi:hypothetical protein